MYEWDEETNDDGDVVEVKGKQLMTDAEATALIKRFRDIYEKGQMMRSYAYYVANQIRAAKSEADASNLNSQQSTIATP